MRPSLIGPWNECDGCGAGDLGDSCAAVDVGDALLPYIHGKEVKGTVPPVRNRRGVLYNVQS